MVCVSICTCLQNVNTERDNSNKKKTDEDEEKVGLFVGVKTCATVLMGVVNSLA